MAIGTKVIQVTNIAPQATKDQMQTLFGYLGKIEDIRLYPTIRDVSCPVQSRICYIKFVETSTVGIAQHMTNTVFIDRALIVIPIQNGEIPDEYFALEMTRNGTIVPGLCPSEPNLPPNVINTVTSTGSGQVIMTYDPKLESQGLPQYPPLPSNYDSHKIEEIRRTIVLMNIDLETSTDEYIDFFSPVAEVKYMRQCTRSSNGETHMLVEFSDQPSIIEVLKLNGKKLKGNPVKIVHAIQAIVKPQAKSNEAAQKEIEEAMSRVKEAQNLISATIDPVIGMLSKDKRSSRRSRSRSRGRRRRSRSRSRSRRSRSRHRSRRSRSTSRKRSKSRERRRRSKSRSRRRSRSHSRRSNSRSRNSKTRRSRSKSRSKTSRRHKSKERAKSVEKSKESSSKGRDRDRSRERKSKEKEKERDSKEKKVEKETGSSTDVDEKRSNKKRSRSHSRNKYRSRSRERKRSRSRDKRSRSRGRRRTPSPRSTRKRSRSRSRDHKRDKKDKREKKEKSPSAAKGSRNYDEEEKGYDAEKKRKESGESGEPDTQVDKDSKDSEKSDNMDISNSP